jgi:dephospho-CoA kinase
MKVIGLTGNIASGKSEVSKMLANLGAKIIDMDSIGKKIQAQNKGHVVDKIVQIFGAKFFKSGKLDRHILGNYIFSNEEALEKLNEIMIPEMTKELERILDIERRENTETVVIDAAILFEAGWDKFTDEVWVVYTPKMLQISRLVNREQITKDEAEIRVNAQMPIEEKIKRADFVIDNSKDLNSVKRQVIYLWNRVKNSI